MADDLLSLLKDAHGFLRDPLLKDASDRIETLEGVLRQLAHPPKGVAFGGVYTIWAMETARTALEGKDAS